MKKIILLMTIVLCTACSAEYNLTLNDKNELMNLVTIWFYDDPNESDD